MDVYFKREKECFMGESWAYITVHLPSYGALRYEVKQGGVSHELYSDPCFWNSPETFAYLRERGERIEVPDDLVQRMVEEHTQHVAPVLKVKHTNLVEIQRLKDANEWKPKERHENFGEKLGDLFTGMVALHVLSGISSAMHQSDEAYSQQAKGFYALVDEFHANVESACQKLVCA